MVAPPQLMAARKQRETDKKGPEQDVTLRETQRSTSLNQAPDLKEWANSWTHTSYQYGIMKK
jgi:hypothetical protein